jgi:hypothetical protein
MLTYFGAWKPPPTAVPRLAYYQDTLFPELEYEQVRMACEVRGKDTHGLNKAELLNVRVVWAKKKAIFLVFAFQYFVGVRSRVDAYLMY